MCRSENHGVGLVSEHEEHDTIKVCPCNIINTFREKVDGCVSEDDVQAPLLKQSNECEVII